ncbi:MAG: choice-of-anchor D domain-containing protein [Acidobacteria bacterium]|nr:choice-of-anchor D domain-containing protein [Acidobacteriota bacterium]
MTVPIASSPMGAGDNPIPAIVPGEDLQAENATSTGFNEATQQPAATLVRSVVYNQITSFPSGGFASFNFTMKVSGNGSRIIFSTAEKKIFTLNADGTNLRQVFDYATFRTGCPCVVPYIDITADGSRVIWTDRTDEIFVADFDGGNQRRVATAIPRPGLTPVPPSIPLAPRITAGGQQILFVHNDFRPGVITLDVAGVWRVNADGSGLTQLFSYRRMATEALGRNPAEYNPNIAFSRGFDISDDGRRVVLGTADAQLQLHTVSFDGVSLRELMTLAPGNDRGLALSGDGRRVALTQEIRNSSSGNIERVALISLNFDGTSQIDLLSDMGRGLAPLQLSYDGSRLIGQSDLLRFITLWNTDGSGRTVLASFDCFDARSANPFQAGFPSLTADGRRFALTMGNLQRTASQIWMADIDPPAPGNVPIFSDVRLSPNYVLADGSTTATVSASFTGSSGGVRRVCFDTLRDGAVQEQGLRGTELLDDGSNGDSIAGDGVFTNSGVRRGLATQGPLTIRVNAFAELAITSVEALPFFVLPQAPSGSPPMITAIDPPAGPAGAQVTILGANFDPIPVNNIILFSARQAVVLSGSGTALRVIVPIDLPDGSVLVTVYSGGRSSNSVGFTIGTLRPNIQVSTPSVEFGSLRVGLARDQSLRITNLGTAPLVISSITSDHSQFVLVSTPLPLTIAPGAQHVLIIRFVPTQAGLMSGILSINSNDPLRPGLQVNLRGIGLAVNNTPRVNRVEVSRATLSHGRLDDLRPLGLYTPSHPTGISIAGFSSVSPSLPPGLVQVIAAQLVPQRITFDSDGDGLPDPGNPIVTASAGLPSCFTLVVAEGITDSDGDPVRVQWDYPGPRFGGGNYYATVDLPDAGIFAGMELTTFSQLRAYDVNSILWEAPDVGPIIVDELLDGGKVALTVLAADKPPVPLAPRMSYRSALVDYAETIRAEIVEICKKQITDTTFSICVEAQISGNFEPTMMTWFRWAVESSSATLVMDVPADNRFLFAVPVEEVSSFMKITVVASSSGLLAIGNPNPFLNPVSPAVGLSTFESAGCTISDTAIVVVEETMCAQQCSAGPEICGDGVDNDGDNLIDEDCGTVRIYLEDSGSARDDVFRLFVDGADTGLTPEGKGREYALDSLTPGDHTVVVEVVKAPDAVGTYTMRLLGGLSFVSRDAIPFLGRVGCDILFLDTIRPDNMGPDDCGAPAEGTRITYVIRR